MKKPLITMSAVTGRPTKEYIFNYCNMLKSNGIDQIMVYPRSGCEIEYLSNEWFKTVGNFVKAALEYDMNIWLYDDFNWPSGHAGGKVTADAHNRLKSIYISGENKGEITNHSEIRGSLFGEKYLPDLLNPETVDRFIELTHEAYYKHFGKYFGTVIKGIFTDEPCAGTRDTQNTLPYYNEMETEYRSVFGRNFHDDMTASYENFQSNVMYLTGERFRKCFSDKISEWCKNHNIIMTGHLFCDSEPLSATKFNGDLLKVLSGFTMPGIDETTTNFENKLLFTVYGAAEYSKNTNGAMAELFAVGPCDMTFSKKICALFLAACFKVDHYFLAISPMDMRGCALIKDYFNCFTDDQPDFEGTKLLAEKSAIAAEYANLDFTPDVYIVYPTEICSHKVTINLNGDTTPFVQLINKLTYNQIQWKYLQSSDDSGNIPVITFDDNLNPLLNGKPMQDISEIQHKVHVTDENSNIPTGIFVRAFDNGSFIALNLTGKEGFYKSSKGLFYLGKHGVFISDKDNYTQYEKQSADISFDITYKNPNVIRGMYINDCTDFEIICESDTEVIFAVRKNEKIQINGKQLPSDNACTILSRGYKNLYSQTDTVLLKKGTYTITCGNDYKYLPSILVTGDFQSNYISDKICSVVLSDRKKHYICGEKFSSYGKIEFTTEITIPADAQGIEITGTELYTVMSINDIPAGECICSPYIYKINPDFYGKRVVLKITQFSTNGPIFGDISYFDANDKSVKWNLPYRPQKTFFGFDGINFIRR